MATQFKFEKQDFSKNDWMYLNAKPQHVIMLQLQGAMKSLKIRSFKSYLNKYTTTKKVQRTSLPIIDIANLLNISTREADSLAVSWMNDKDTKGRVTYCADVAAYYLSDVYEIVS